MSTVWHMFAVLGVDIGEAISTVQYDTIPGTTPPPNQCQRVLGAGRASEPFTGLGTSTSFLPVSLSSILPWDPERERVKIIV